MYDDKIMRVTDYLHSRCGRFQSHTEQDLVRTMSPQETGKKWRPLRPIISEITTAIRSRTLISTNINTLQ